MVSTAAFAVSHIHGGGHRSAGEWMGFGQSPGVTTRNGWLRLEPGAAGLRTPLGYLRHVHVLAWRRLKPTDAEDEWSRTFLDFKNGSPDAARKVTSLFLERLPPLLNDLVGPREPVNLVTALSAIDAEPNPNRPLHRLAASVDGEIGRCHFRERLLRKAAHKRLTDCLSFEERDGTVDGVYSAAADVYHRRIGNGSFLILDDFVTRGSTFADISRALRRAYSDASIHAAALAKHVWADTLQSLGYDEYAYNRHLPRVATS